MGIAQAVRGDGAPELHDVLLPCATFGWPGSWALGSQPQSVRHEASWEWHVPVKEVATLFSRTAGQLESQTVNFGGYAWQTVLAVEPYANEEGAPGMTLGCFLEPSLPWAYDELPAGTKAPVMVTSGLITCSARASLGQRLKGIKFDKVSLPMDASSELHASIGSRDFGNTGLMERWDAARFAPWTNSSGQLQLRGNINTIL